MAAATTPADVAELILALAGNDSGCDWAVVSWDPLASMPSAKQSAIGVAEAALVQKAAASSLPEFSLAGNRLAIPLVQSTSTVLLVAIRDPASGRRFLKANATLLHLAGHTLYSALESARLKHSVSALERSELLQRSLFAISDLAGSDCDMPELLKGIHAIVDSC